LVDVLFATGLGDQMGSLLEIFYDRDDIRLSRLELVHKLGEGGFGMVFKVLDIRNKQLHALKLQRRNKAATMAVKEATILHNVRLHPFIVHVDRIFQTPGFYAILMELCDIDLNKCILQGLNSQGISVGLPSAQVKRYAACMLLGLEFLHQRKVIFRDLKPQNVLIVAAASSGPEGTALDFGRAKLADFGLARSCASFEEPSTKVDEIKSTAKKKLTLGGTPAFMPPEAFEERELPGGPGLVCLRVLLDAHAARRAGQPSCPPQPRVRLAPSAERGH